MRARVFLARSVCDDEANGASELRPCSEIAGQRFEQMQIRSGVAINQARRLSVIAEGKNASAVAASSTQTQAMIVVQRAISGADEPVIGTARELLGHDGAPDETNDVCT